MKKLMVAVLGLAVAALGSLSLASPAAATNESAEIGLSMNPLSGSLSKTSYKAVNWRVTAKINTPDLNIQPMKEANLHIEKGALTFNPDRKMPVCPDSEVGPGKTSVDVPTIVARCPKSILGNGVATFALAQLTSQPRDGVMIIFNGGTQKSGPLKGQPRIKIYAYSYDVNVGIYTEAALAKDGSLDFKIPQLTADSSVTSLDLSIPSKPVKFFVASQGKSVVLPKGQNPSYARAKCADGGWDYSAQFLLGDRNTAGAPTSPTTELNESGVEPCKGSGSSGGGGKAKFGALRIKGAGKARAGRSAFYKVTVRNASRKAIKGVRVVASGKGARGARAAGTLKPGKARTVKVKVKFTKRGKVALRFKATGRGAAAKVGKKVVTVK